MAHRHLRGLSWGYQRMFQDSALAELSGGLLVVSGGRLLLLLLNRTCLFAGIWKVVHTAFSAKALNVL